MFRLILTFLFSFLSLSTPVLAQHDAEALLQQADQYREEKSFHQAAQIYLEILKSPDLAPALKREVEFKSADSSWRTKDQLRYEDAVAKLKELSESADHDRWWAEASESLAEHYLEIDRWSHQNEIKPLLENAREFWAGSKDIELARPRFIKATFTLGDYISQNWGWYYQDIRPASAKQDKKILPPDQPQNNGLNTLYEEILQIVKNDEDKAKVYYSLAMSIVQNYYGDQKKKDEAVKYFRKVIDELPKTEYVDDAYYYLGNYYEQKQDLNEALKVYQEFVSKFKIGESQWLDDISRRIKDITSPQISLSTSYNFLPGSEVQFNLNWRNVSSAQLAIYKMDLVDVLQLDDSKREDDYDRGVQDYQGIIRKMVEKNTYSSLPKVLSADLVLKDEGKHQNYSETKGLADWLKRDDKENANPAKGVLDPGAYLLLVSSGGQKAYDLILVTDLGIVTKTGGHTALIFAFDGKTGEPRVEARVKYQYRYYNNQNRWSWEQGEGTTDSQGLLKVAFESENSQYNNQRQIFAVVSDGKSQAFAQGNYYNYYEQSQNWRLYAYSDRPAYRPNEEVQFKGTLRRYDDKTFHTPSQERVKAFVIDPRGNKVLEKEYTLNDFGTFNDALTLDDKAALGEYRLEIYTPDLHQQLASSTLFRLEEYKLPEFLITIKPKVKNDKSASYQLGDQIEMEVDAQYYFGGAVADAEVEYLVYQNPYYHYYQPVRDYPWYYETQNQYEYYNYPGSGTLLKKEKIKTDKEGKASFKIETPENAGTDLQYRIEVRIVDQSRREITASSTVKVTKDAFYAYLNLKHNLYRPGDKAEVDIKTLTANEEPVSVDGKITITRNWWTPAPQPLPVDQLTKRSDEAVATPSKYEETEILTKFVKTDAKGEALFSFEPSQDGYYVVKFTAFDQKGKEVNAQTNVFVCDKNSKDLGYQYSGIQIISEKDTYSIGETARIMLVANKPGTWVLLSTEADEIFDYQMVKLDGAVKLIEIPVEATFTPNIYFNALSAENYQLKFYTLPIVVPPDEKFLNIKVVSDKETYRPQEEGTFNVEVTDKNGHPVQGELSLGITDKSVYYIQEEFAGDIRQFFYGKKREESVQTNSSFNYRPYQKLVRNDDGQLTTEDALRQSLLAKDKEADQKQGKKDNGSLGDELQSVDSMRGVGQSAAFGGNYRNEFAKRELRSDMPASAPTVALKSAVMAEGKMVAEEASAAPGEAQLQTPTLRQDFRSTVLWQPAVATDENGKAVIKVKFPDSLTTWRTTARSITQDTSVGNTTYETKTKKDVIVRLQAPRFFTERDEVVISANVNNYTDKEQKIKVAIKAEGLELKDKEEVWVTVPADGEQRVDWKTIAQKEGTAKITVSAQATEDADAMVKSYPIIPHGIEKFIAQAVELKDDQTKSFTVNIPKERIKESTSLQLNFSPSLAATLLDSLPYLARFPYGCVEQTMSRFLPTVIVKKTLRDLGLKEEDINQYISDVMTPRNDPDYPNTGANTLADLDKMTKDGLSRLYDFQHSDGGWGWWKDGDSDRFMSAYVVWGLSLAKEAGVNVKADVISRGVRFLQTQLVEEEDQPDMLAWMLHALSVAKSSSEFENKQIERLWEMREKLNPYSRALFALSQYYRGDSERAEVLARNLINGIQEDKENGTAHWGEAGINWRWSDGGVEATAFTIKALANILPDSEWIDPAVKWMVLNRRGGRWKNTRDTAIAVLSLADYLKATKELNPDYDYAVTANGKSVQTGHVNAQNIFTFNRIVRLNSDQVKDGENKVEVTLKGKGKLFVSGYLKYFTKEENITPAGNEIFVERKYFTEDTAETLLKGYTTDWQPLKDGAAVKSGQRIRVEVTLDAKNNYEYLVSEDYKPAGLEAVELKSGSAFAVKLDYKGKESGEQIYVYQELRDQKAVFFIDKLNQGKYKLVYELRAEVPGTFHAMPNQTHAMYVPEIRANSAEAIVMVVDK